jgi:hypothetical protein
MTATIDTPSPTPTPTAAPTPEPQTEPVARVGCRRCAEVRHGGPSCN